MRLSSLGAVKLLSSCFRGSLSHLFKTLSNAELSLSAKLTRLHIDETIVEANRSIQIALRHGNVCKLQKGVVDEAAVRKLALQPLSNCMTSFIPLQRQKYSPRS